MAITLNDLIKCQQGDIIVSMLIDAKAFFDYDQRENGQTLEVYDDFWYAVNLCLMFSPSPSLLQFPFILYIQIYIILTVPLYIDIFKSMFE